MRSLSVPAPGHDSGRLVAAADCIAASSGLFVTLYVVRYPIMSPLLVTAVVELRELP